MLCRPIDSMLLGYSADVLIKLMLQITAPFFAFKQATSVVQLFNACSKILAVDETSRKST